MKKSDERQKKVLDLLNNKKFVTSEEMVSHLQMSTAKVRRLLAQMEQQALLRRFHGGVSLRGGYSNLTDTYITFGSEKKRIAVHSSRTFLNLPIQKILMADHSKIGKKRPFIAAPLSQYTCLVTDKDTEGLDLLRDSLPIYLAP